MVRQCTAIVFFTRKRNLEALTPPVFYQQRLQTVQDVKYLTIILDVKPLWNNHLQLVNIKTIKGLMTIRQKAGNYIYGALAIHASDKTNSKKYLYSMVANNYTPRYSNSR